MGTRGGSGASASSGHATCCIFCLILIGCLVGGFLVSVAALTWFAIKVGTLSPFVGYDLPVGYTKQLSWQLAATLAVVISTLLALCLDFTPQVGKWPCIDAKPVSGEELTSLQVEFGNATRAYAGKYGSFGVRLVSAHRVVNATLDEAFAARRAVLRDKGKSDTVSRLYHGTTSNAGRAIIRHGFRLPRKAGMFGKGIYFADTPLKSLQYTRGKHGVMLVCDVALGNSMVKRSCDSKLEAESKSFKRGLLPRIMGQKSFDSVTAATGWLGAVRVPEYVIYNRAQAVPRFVLIVEKTT